MTKVIQTGVIKSRLNSKSYAFKIIHLQIKHLPQILALQDHICKTTGRKGFIVKRSSGYLRQLLISDGIILGVLVRNKLVAMTAVRFPKATTQNLRIYVGIPKSQRNRIVQFELSMVHPEFIGNGLQKLMIVRIAEIAIRKHHPQYSCCAVSAVNYHSLNNVFRYDTLVRGICIGKNRIPRLFIYRNISKPKAIDPGTSKMVRPMNYALQFRLLKKGYCGYQLTKKNNGYWLKYAKIANS